MLTPEDTLLIGIFVGFAVGYPVAFFVARAVYRKPTWPG